VKGATNGHVFGVSGECFNPRAREGRDGYLEKSFQEMGVSIHAPVKGATGCAVRRTLPQRVSIHAPVKGATRAWRGCWAIWRCFNPRAREGRDPFRAPHRHAGDVSIHAPVKGATWAACFKEAA